MKIIKTREQAQAEKRLKEIAHENCHKCPFCGETRSLWDAICEDDDNGGIMDFRVSYSGGLFSRGYDVTRYVCNRCGAEWESDPIYAYKAIETILK